LNLIDDGGYKNTDVENPKGGYWESSIITIDIPILVLHCALFLVVHSKIIFCGNLHSNYNSKLASPFMMSFLLI
jgi:hypothetical protein